MAQCGRTILLQIVLIFGGLTTVAAGQTQLALTNADPIAGGALLFHGNYCGPGNRGPNMPPTDALDRACMHHDACTPGSELPKCACNARLRYEANLVTADPRQPPDLQALAGAVETGANFLPCKP